MNAIAAFLDKHWTKSIVLLLILALVIRFYVSGMRVFVSPDSMAYWNTAQALLSGHWEQAYIERTPGYVVFLMALQAIGTLWANPVSPEFFQKLLLPTQSLLGILNVWLVTRIGLSLLKSRPLALLSGLLVAFWPDLLLYEHAMLSETLYTTSILLWVSFCLRQQQKPLPDMVFSIALGILTGWLIWIKPIALSFALCSGIWIWYFTKKRSSAIISFTTVLGLWVLPWMLFNAQAHGVFIYAAGRGANQLYKMVDAVNWDSPAEADYKARLHERYNIHPAGETYNAVNDVHVLMDEAAKRQPNYSAIYLQHDQSAGIIAWEAIRAHPFHFIGATLKQGIDFFFKAPLPIVPLPLFITWSVISWQLWQIIGTLGLIGIAIAVQKRQWHYLLMGGTVLSHAVLYAITTYADARYRVPFEPLIILLGIYALQALVMKAPAPEATYADATT